VRRRHNAGIPLVRAPFGPVVLLHQRRGLLAGGSCPAHGQARHAGGGPDRPGRPVRSPAVRGGLPPLRGPPDPGGHSDRTDRGRRSPGDDAGQGCNRVRQPVPADHHGAHVGGSGRSCPHHRTDLRTGKRSDLSPGAGIGAGTAGNRRQARCRGGRPASISGCVRFARSWRSRPEPVRGRAK
jgi:hypothetical protein